MSEVLQTRPSEDKRQSVTDDDSLLQLYKKQKVKKVVKSSKNNAQKAIPMSPNNEESNKKDINQTNEPDNIIYKSSKDFQSLDDRSEILKDMDKIGGKCFLTKAEKRSLEEITKCTSKVRAPLDERQMAFYNKDCERFSTSVDLKESEDIPSKDIMSIAVTLNESPSNVMTADITTLVSYLANLRSLIAKREMAWASATESDYAQKAEIKRLKTEVENLRIIVSKRQMELKEKEQAIADKEQELLKWQRMVQKLKKRLITLEKTSEDDLRIDDMPIKTNIKSPVPSDNRPKTKLQMVEEALLAEARNKRVQNPPKQAAKASTMELRKNQGIITVQKKASPEVQSEDLQQQN